MSNDTTVKQVAAAVTASPVSNETLADQLEKILKQRDAAKVEAAKPKEPDWSKVTEADITNPAVFIPVIDHDIPDYMDVKLKDEAYIAVWANKDQRRVGQLIAEGYELLKKEHIHPDFKLPLKFESDGSYTYLDVICFRVHKRIVYGKRRQALEASQKQLRNTNRPPKTRFNEDEQIELGPGISMYEAGL